MTSRTTARSRLGHMRAARRRVVRAAIESAAARAEALEPRLLLAAVSWDGGGNDFNWNNPLNWSTDSLPTAADDVAIDVPASSPTITLSGPGQTAVRSLSSQEPVLVTGRTLTLDRVEAPELSLLNGAVLTTFDPTTATMHHLQVAIAGTLSVDSTSRIDVSLKGYLPGRTTGNTTAGGATGSSGGSYGGLGALRFGARNAVYGGYKEADDWGGGGGAATGGGRVSVTAGSFALNGQLLANGQDGGGAGGGVHVRAAALSGSGSIRANGGIHDSGGSGFAAGGGGRVALYSADLSGFDTRNIMAHGGGRSPSGAAAGSGTVYVQDTDEPKGTLYITTEAGAGQAGLGVTPLGVPGQQALIFDHPVVIVGRQQDGAGPIVQPEHPGMTITFQDSVTIRDGSLTLDGLQVGPETSLDLQSRSVLAVNGTLASSKPLTFGNGSVIITDRVAAPALSLVNGATLTTFDASPTLAHPLVVDVAGVLIIDSTSRIDVTAKGYLPGRTTGNSTSGAAYGGAGGSYGGLGGASRSNTGTGAPNATYGDGFDPAEPGSGGGQPLPQGRGGGLARITAGEVVLDGQLLADGQAPVSGGGGSGGGLLIEAGRLRGSGIARAAGGIAVSSLDIFAGTFRDAGAGGGGRIAVYAQDLSGFTLANLSAPGGVVSGGRRGQPGAAGTVHAVQGRRHTHVASYVPAGINGGYVTSGFDHVTLTFNKPIDPATLTPADFLIEARGSRLAPTAVVPVGEGSRSFRMEFARFDEAGAYRFTLLPSVTDAEGFLLDQNANGVPGEAQDVLRFTLTIDTVPPRVMNHTPAGDVSGTLAHVDVFFSERIDLSTFTPADVTITGPAGTIAATSVTEVGFNRYRVLFPAQTAVGQYRLHVGSDVQDLAGNPAQPAGGYDATVNLVAVDLGLGSLPANLPALVAGDSVTLSWTGMNRTGAPLIGDWTDGVYLSADDRWDIDDALLATVRHTGGLAEQQPYTASATAVVPGRLPGNYHILVRADIQNDAREAAGEANNVVASAALPLTVRGLTDGIAAVGSLTPEDREDYYAITVAPGDSLGLTLDGLAAGGINELHVSRGSIPTRQSFDLRSVKGEADVNRLDHELALTAPAEGGTYYVLLFGEQIHGASAGYRLTATTGDLILTGITPDHHGNGAPGEVTLRGAGFDESTAVEFVGRDGQVRPATGVRFVSAESLTARLDLADWLADLYDVRVTNGNSTDVLPEAFTVVPGGAARLETNLIVPSAVGFAIPIRQTIWIEYRNAGDLPMPAPLLQLKGSHGARLTADVERAVPRIGFGTIPGITDTVQVLATGSSQTPWLLQPGESARLPVYYIGLSQPSSYPRVSFELSHLTASDLRPVQWRSQESAIRPAGITGRAWEVLLSRLQAGVGTTWGAYASALASATQQHWTQTGLVPSVSEAWTLSIGIPTWVTQLFTDYDPLPNHVGPSDVPVLPVECINDCNDDWVEALNARDHQDVLFNSVKAAEGVLDATIWSAGAVWLRAASSAFGKALGAVTGLRNARGAAQRLSALDPSAAEKIKEAVGSMLNTVVPIMDLARTLKETATSGTAAAVLSNLRDTYIAGQLAYNDTLAAMHVVVNNVAPAHLAAFSSVLGIVDAALYFLGDGFDRDIQACFDAWTEIDIEVDRFEQARATYEPSVTTANLELAEYKQCLAHCQQNPDPPTLTVSDVSVIEGNVDVPDPSNPPANTSYAVFTVSMNRSSTTAVAFDWDTVGPVSGSADPGWDFVRVGGTMVFQPGETRVELWVPIIGDTSDESDEYFFLFLNSPVNAVINDGRSTGWIIDDDDPPPPPSGPPQPPMRPGPSGSSAAVGSFDPNDKLAPAGYGPAAHIQSDGVFAYVMRFENKSDATAPAREITVTDVLNSDLDLDTLELTEIAFANHRITLPPGLREYRAAVALTLGGATVRAEAEASVDRATRTLTLTLRAIDPLTGYFHEDPLVGLLHPNDLTGRGEGSISYIVRPRAGLPTGTVIRNQARIVFDFNDPIDTPEVFNTLDAAPPTSNVAILPATSGESFAVRWSGADDASGSGVGGYDVYVSDNGGPYTPWLVGTADISATFTGVPGHAYAFYSVARDNVGHVEAAPDVPDAQITVPADNAPPILSLADRATTLEGTAFALAGSFVDPDDGDDWTATVNYGDGSGVQPLVLRADKTFDLHHVYADDGAYTVTVTIADGEGGVGSHNLTVTAANAAPTIALNGAAETDEGSAYTLELGPITDPGDDAVTEYIVHWGDGSAPESFATGGPITHTFADGPAAHTITVDLVDDDGTYPAAGSVAVNVRNRAPSVTVTGASSVLLRTEYTLHLGAADPGTDTLSGWRIDWGDGVTDTLSADATSATHAYAAGGVSRTVTATAIDEDGSYSATLKVRVLTAQQAAALVIGRVDALVASGSLNHGQGNALRSKLEAAIRSLDRGSTNAASGQLNAFMNQVNAWRGNQLSQAEADPLVNDVLAILKVIP